MLAPVTVETKVAAPAIATAVVSTLGAAVYALILAFGWLHPTSGQTAALAGMGAAIVYVVQVAVGYLAPHTPRADLSAPKPPIETPYPNLKPSPFSSLGRYGGEPTAAPDAPTAQKAEPTTSVQVIAPTPAAEPPAPAAPASPVAP